MIARLAPRLAAYPSVYGRPFDRAPTLSERLRAEASYRRPLWLRRLSYRLQQRQAGALPYFLSPDRLASVMEAGFPYLRALFRPERIVDPEAFNRMRSEEHTSELQSLMRI